MLPALSWAGSLGMLFLCLEPSWVGPVSPVVFSSFPLGFLPGFPCSDRAAEAPPETTQKHPVLAAPVPFLGLCCSIALPKAALQSGIFPKCSELQYSLINAKPGAAVKEKKPK